MHRRTFLRCATVAVLGSVVVSGAKVASISKSQRTDRIGCTTVSFRQRFATTRLKGVSPEGADLSFLGQPGLTRFDVVVLMFKNYQPIANEEQAWKNPAGFVRSGKGLAVIHFASGAFPDRPEFRDFIGHAQQKKHDRRGPFTVKIMQAEHGITRGMANFETDDERFIDLAGSRPVEVIATAKSNITGQDHPMAFVLTNDLGRVFHTTLGHDARALLVSGTGELIRRGTAWAAGQLPERPAKLSP